MGVTVLKLHYIYLFIGISTLVLNLALTMHLIRKHTSTSSKESWDCDQVITFRLTKENSAEGVTTAAVPYEDTIPLE